MRRTTFTAAIALLTVMAGPPALAQAPFGIGTVLDGNNNAISFNVLRQVTTNGSPSGLSIGPGGIAIGGASGLAVGPGGIAIGGASGFAAGPGGIAIGGASGLAAGPGGIAIGGAADFEAEFGD